MKLRRRFSPEPDRSGGGSRKKRVDIHIGEIHASKIPTVIYTLLGSCVAVCLFDASRRIGGMNHILMPGRAAWNTCDRVARYGLNAMEMLLNRILRLGGRRQRMAAKVFGGAHMFPHVPPNYGAGQKNAALAVEFLQKESIEIVNHDLGGTDTRKIYFHTDTGEVFLKRVRSKQALPILRKEEEMLRQIQAQQLIDKLF